MDDRERLIAGLPPRWASAWGEDEYGVFAAFAVGEVEQRLRWIPPGTFRMGSPTGEVGRWEDEGPAHDVTITRGYWLGETPVTQALWQVVMGENPSGFQGDDRRPVEHVSWERCVDFIAILNRRVEGLAVRLPTEAEWERACREETRTATWAGNLSNEDEAPELDAIAWYGANSGGTTHPVGEKRPNPYGLHDLLGNVHEWCADLARRYAADPASDPVGAEGGSLVWGSGRVFRGGSWLGGARYARAAYRLAFPPGFAYGYLGFRLAGDQESAPGQARRATRSGAPEPRSGDPGRGAAPAAARDATTPSR